MNKVLQPHENVNNQPSLFTRQIFIGEDLDILKSVAEVEKAAVTWDVGVPMVGERPALDDRLLAAGRTHKERVELKIKLDEAEGILSIEIAKRHGSRTDTTSRPFGLPIISEVEPRSIFSEENSGELYETITLNIHKNGLVMVKGETDIGNSEDVFNGTHPNNLDYSSCINFAERMLVVPVDSGHLRAPLGDIVADPRR